MVLTPVEEILWGIVVALAAGGLIGLERERSGRRGGEERFGGVRTFPLMALAGAASALVAREMGPGIVLTVLAVVSVMIAISHHQLAVAKGHVGVTTALAAVLTFVIGVIAGMPTDLVETSTRSLIAMALAGVTMALLSFREPLHDVVERITADDIYATSKFALVALVVLPLLPDRTMGPLDVLNPFHTGIMVALIAGISFVGYAASRLVGSRRGLVVTGILGGLVSSTAVTMSMSQRARETPAVLAPAAAAIIAASTTMFARILVTVGIIDAPLLGTLAVPMGVMVVTGFGIALVTYLRGHRVAGEGGDVALTNPFELSSALKFGLLFAVVLFVAKAAQVYVGEQGLYLSSLVAGTTDVDAITLSMARLHREGLAGDVAATAITIAAVTNTFVKMGIAAWISGRELGLRIFFSMGVVLAAGGATLVFLG